MREIKFVALDALNRVPPRAVGGDVPAPDRRAGAVFAILFALMVVDYVDRQIVVSMFPHLAAQWSLSDRELGALASIVSITVAIFAVPLSVLADRWSRAKSLFLMALVWSGATIACAYAASYGMLLAARGVVGLGEAAYGSTGAALLAGTFDVRRRSTVLGAFFAAAVVGSVVGVVLGGVIAERWGWRMAFGAVGIPGLALALILIAVVRDGKPAEPPASQRSAAGTAAPCAIAAALLEPRALRMACMGAGLQLVTVSSSYAWLPSYFNRFYGLAPDRAGLMTGVIILLGGAGAVLSSVIADRLTGRFPAARLHVPAIAAVSTTTLMCIAFAALSPGTAQLAFIVAGATVMTGTIGPLGAAVLDVVHPAWRATAAAVLALTQNLIGLAAGPLVVGALSDAYGLPFALAATPVVCLFAAVMFVVAARTYVADVENAAAGVALRAPRPPPRA